MHQYAYAGDQQQRSPGNPFDGFPFVCHVEEGKYHGHRKTGQAHVHFIEQHQHHHHCNADQGNDLVPFKRRKIFLTDHLIRVELVAAQHDIYDSCIHGGR